MPKIINKLKFCDIPGHRLDLQTEYQLERQVAHHPAGWQFALPEEYVQPTVALYCQ